MKKTLSLCIVAALVLALCVPAFADDEVVYTVALDSDIVALDPAYAYDFTTNPVVNQITESILTFDQNNQIQPLLCESWEAVDDTTYVYQIRSDINFSDGNPMTMDDVVYSVKRHMDPEVASYLSWMFDSVESIEQTGDWELTVKLTQPSATWQYIFGTSAGAVLEKTAMEETGELIGTGAFKYEDWMSGQEITLVKNENYRDAANVAIDKLVYKIIPEDVTRITALKTGEVDCAFVLPAEMMEMLDGSENVTTEAIETFGVTVLSFNTQMAPLNEVNVRKAIYHAIDFETIQNELIKNAGEAGTVLPNSAALYSADTQAWEDYAASAPVYEYDVEKAKAYLADSSVPDGFSTTLVTNENSLRYNICLAIQEYLAAININVDIVKVDGDTHTNYQFGGIFNEEGLRDYGMIICGWEADYPDISGNVEPLCAGYNAGEGGSNSAVYCNDTVDELLRKQGASLDAAERDQLMFQALDIITDEIPNIYVMYTLRNVAYSTEFTGFSMNASWIWNTYFKDLKPVA